MSDEPEGSGAPGPEKRLLGEIEARARRREREAGYTDRGFWVGVGAMGLIGWGVVVPAVAGGFLGIWIDGRLGLTRTFSALLAFGGLALGCWNAWRMIRKVLDSGDHDHDGPAGPADDGGAGK